MRNHFRKMIGNSAVAATVSLAFLGSALISTRSSRAGSPVAQAPGVTVKIQTKVEAKVEPKPEAKEEPKAKTAEAPAPIGAAVNVIREAVAAVQAEIVGAVAGPGAANAEGMANQFIQQFRPILMAELRVLSSASEPTPAQRREIAIEGARALKKAASKMAEAQVGMMNGRGVREVPDPYRVVREALETAAKSKLSADQVGRYQKEVERRAKDERETVMLNLVTNIDQLLLLSTEQRQKLSESLLSHWDAKEYPTLETLEMYEGYFPMISNQRINPILNDDQKKVWAGATKIQFSSIQNFAFFNNIQDLDPAAETADEDVKAAFAEVEVKK